MRTTGDPPTLAPEICVEVMFESNDWEEMKTTTDLYRKAGAEEVWIMGAEGTVRFFAEDEMDGSEIVPDFPSSV